jgi:hypothetical protein
MATVIVVSALGAAGDPANGSGQEATEPWARVHLVAAFIGLAAIGWTYWVVWQYVCANQAVIDSILHEVARIRHQRGLDNKRDLPRSAPLPAVRSAEHG